MNGKAEGRWLGTSPCEIEQTIALRTNALRAYEGKSSELIPPGSRSRVGTGANNRTGHARQGNVTNTKFQCQKGLSLCQPQIITLDRAGPTPSSYHVDQSGQTGISCIDQSGQTGISCRPIRADRHIM